jgi:hypothetical protein
MIRRLARLAAVALPVFLAFALGGCSAAPDDAESLGTSESALRSTDPGPSAVEIKITSFDLATGTITGYNKHGWSYSGVLSDTTTWRQAQLSRFIPTDPCHDLALFYNQNIGDDSAVFATIADMAAFDVPNGGVASCNARIWFDGTRTNVRAFQPMP